MVWPSYNARKLKLIELRYQIRNHYITILLGNQMLKQTITINTSSKNGITSQTQEQWEIKQTNGNENVVLWETQQLCRCIKIIVPKRPLHDYEVKLPKAMLCGGSQHRRHKFSIPRSDLGHISKEFVVSRTFETLDEAK